MHEADVVLHVPLPPHRHPAQRQEPRKKPLDFPAAPVTPKPSSVLCLSTLPVALVRRDHLNASLGQHSVKAVAIVGPVADEALWRSARKKPFKRSRNQRRLMWGSTRHVYGDRKTSAVCNGHDLAALAAPGLAHAGPPFLAEANVASTKHSLKSSLPRAMRSSASALRARASAPLRFQLWNRSCTVDLGGKRLGSSLHWAPVRRIQSEASKQARSLVRGRPRVEVRGGGARCGATSSHCVSVSFMGGAGCDGLPTPHFPDSF